MYSAILVATFGTLAVAQAADTPAAPAPATAPTPAPAPRVEVQIEAPRIEVRIPRVTAPRAAPPTAAQNGWGPGETDTVFPVNPNARLDVKNHAGAIVVRVWEREAVRVVAEHSQQDWVEIHDKGSAVIIRSKTRHGVEGLVDYELTVPPTMAINLAGHYMDADIEGVANGVKIHTVTGDVVIRDCEGMISLESVEGDVQIADSKGRVEIHGVESEVVITGVEGDVFVETIDGDVGFRQIRSRQLEARTVDGDVRFEGPIQAGGHYRLTTHDGDVTVAIADGTSATISVATFDGDLETTFAIQVSEAESRRRFSFTLGTGAAQIELHSFDGDIRLVRPGEIEW